MAVKHWVIAIALCLVAAVVPAWVVSVRTEKKVDALAVENSRLRARVADLSCTTAPPVISQPEPPQGSPIAPRPPRPSGNPEDAIAIQKLKLALADANASIARLQNRADQAEAQVQAQAVDNKRLSASEADLKENLSQVNQAVDALQRELKSSRDRATQVEIAYQKLRDQSGADSKKLADMQQLALELQDIYKRRETYVNSILRRYRQITEQYRSISGVLQAQRTDAPSTSSTDIARIQDSIAMAEEDLRQLNSLDAQAQLIQKRMAAK